MALLRDRSIASLHAPAQYHRAAPETEFQTGATRQISIFVVAFEVVVVILLFRLVGCFGNSEREWHLNLGAERDWLAVREEGFVLPLLHCIDGPLHQQRVPSHHVHRINTARLRDHDLQLHSVLYSNLLPERRLDWCDAIDEIPFDLFRFYGSRALVSLRSGIRAST